MPGIATLRRKRPARKQPICWKAPMRSLPRAPQTTISSLSRSPASTRVPPLDYALELLGVKSPSEFIELSAEHMRKQFDLLTAQNKEICALARELATEAAAPIKAGMSRAYNKGT